MPEVIVFVRYINALIVALMSCAGAVSQSPGLPATQAPQPTPAPMEAAFKNIQVLKGVPSTELLPIMNFIRSSLGVRCEYCHVAENGKYQLDEKTEKQRAREMMLMTRQINQANFRGANIVTCNTCHRGSVRPAAVPEVGSTFVNTTRREPDEPLAQPLPGVAEILSRYEAVTHAAALPALRLTLEASHAKLVNPGTPQARVISRAATNSGEVLIHGTKALARSPLPGGGSVLVGSDGKRAWTLGPNGLRWLPDDDFAQFQRKLNPMLALIVRPSDFRQSRVSGVDVIGKAEAYVVNAIGTDGTEQNLWFATEDGLLVRRTFYHPIALGLDPEQFDFSEYRDYGGFVLPSIFNTSYFDDQHLGVRKKIIDLKLNVPAPDTDFLPPEK
jgi:hypothetical protein